MKKWGIVLVVLVVAWLLKGHEVFSNKVQESPLNTSIESKGKKLEDRYGYIRPNGMTVETRIDIPKGYYRMKYEEGSFQQFISNYPLKPYGSEIINYDGSEHFSQDGHFGILDLQVAENGLQQCADVLIRLYAEYLWEQGRYDDIGFEFTSSHYCSWLKYAEGYRPNIKGNKVTFVKKRSADHSKKNFVRYLNLIYTYSGTLSLYNELDRINDVKLLRIGDMVVSPGTPGHVAMIVDVIANEEGERRFVIMQGYTPSQSISLLKNEGSDMNPWYELKIEAPLLIPGYYFEKAQFMRFK